MHRLSPDRPPRTIGVALALAFALAACRGVSAPPPPSQPPTPTPPTPIAPSPECAEVERALAAAVVDAPDAGFALAAPYETLMAQNGVLARSGEDLVALRDRLTTRPLARAVGDFAQSTHRLAQLTASLAGAKVAHVAELSTYEHGFFLGVRERELARRSAVAQCRDEGSREQSDDWKVDATARLLAMRARLAPCAHVAGDRPVDLRIKMHVGSDGHVVVAGRDVAHGELDAAPASLAVAACLVRVVERTVFAPPRGNAIVVTPFVHPDTR